MRSMRTNGASKNRDWWSSVILSFLECLCYFGTYGMYTYGMYTYGMYTYGNFFDGNFLTIFLIFRKIIFDL